MFKACSEKCEKCHYYKWVGRGECRYKPPVIAMNGKTHSGGWNEGIYPEVNGYNGWCGLWWPKTAKETIKPPLGLMPEKIWKEERCNQLKMAIERYDKAGQPVPNEWQFEYTDLKRKTCNHVWSDCDVNHCTKCGKERGKWL